MHQILLEDIDTLWPQVEQAVDATPGIDPWCSGPDWTVPVTCGFAPDAPRLLLASPDCDGFAFFTKYYTSDQTPMLGGLEPLWGFAAPILGADSKSLTSSVAAHLDQVDDWRLLYLPGMPIFNPEGASDRDMENRATTLAVAEALTSLGHVRLAEGITRQVADMAEGFEPWLARRSGRFRRNLQRAAGKAEQAGLTIENVSEEPELFDRLLAIEHRSWKGQEGSGMTSAEMRITYRLMVSRLQGRSRLHAHVARLDGQDVGYILGGVRGRRYRGLQLSYVDDAHRLSIGNVLQLHQLRELDKAGLADTYDLGMDFEYKRRWADRAETSLAIVVHRA